MKNKHYVLTETDKKRLERQIERLEGAPPPAMLPKHSPHIFAAPDAYWALPPCETGLPAAERTSDGSIRPGIALCCLYRYDPAYDKLMPVQGPTGTPFKVLVRNSYTQVTNDFVQVWRHKDGTWTNEKPSPISTITTTQDPDIVVSNPIFSNCEGACVWVATAGLTWEGPVGGCRNTSTTTTTTQSPTTTSTTTLAPTTTTLPPCPSAKCRLRCVAATTTTPAPGQPPAPETGYKYQVTGTTCAAPCSCYGVNEPCYVPNGEIESRCVYINPTTTSSPTTTTTGGPLVGSPACQIIENAIGATPAGFFRAAALAGGVGGWQICQDCPPGFGPLRALGSDEPVAPNGDPTAVFHQSKCVKSPCDRIQLGTLDTTGLAIYVAYTYQELVNILGGIENADDYLKVEEGRYLANWFLCSSCGNSARPLYPPKPWLFIDPARNAEAPISLTLNASNVFQYFSACAYGPSCSSCKYLSPYGGMQTTAPPPINTTPSPSTTPSPCGCEPPGYCPVAAGECVKTVCRPGGAGTITCPITTPVPGAWCQETCVNCHCDAGEAVTTTTVTTTFLCGGNCTRVWIPGNCIDCWQYFPDSNTCSGLSSGRCLCNWPTTTFPPFPATTPPPTTPPCGTVQTVACIPYTAAGSTSPPVPCKSCVGTCIFGVYITQSGEKVWTVVNPSFGYAYEMSCEPRAQNGGPCNLTIGSGNTGQTNPGTSAYFTCSSYAEFFNSYFSDWVSADSYGFCGCRRPSNPPSSYCELAQTPCETKTVCGCCEAASCAQKCAFRGNGYGGWTKISDPCPTSCPCPQRPYQNSDDECDRIEIGCGSIIPPPSTTITSTSTTTLGPGACCYPGPVCTYGFQKSCIAARGGVWQGAGTSCSGGTCNSFTTTSTTTEGPGRCCHSQSVGEPQVCTWTYRTFCNQLSGIFTPGVACPGFYCQLTTTTTTTSGPLGTCCRIGGGPCVNSVPANHSNCEPGTWRTSGCSHCYGRCCITCPDGSQTCYDNVPQEQCSSFFIGNSCGTVAQPVPGSFAWTSGESCAGVCNASATTTANVTATPPPLGP